jgi:hypothetical protein
MNSHLTYRPRDGVVFGVVAGKAIQLATLRSQVVVNIEAWREAARSGETVVPRVTPWLKVQEVRPGRAPAGALGQKLTVAENAALEIYDHPGEYAQRFDGVDPGGAAGGAANHWHHARVVWVKLPMRMRFAGGGLSLHGPPACGNARCIVIAQEWDPLFNALRATRQLSLVVEL